MDMPAGQTQLRILLLEDQPTDAELAENALREAGLSFVSRRVDTREAFMQALEEFKPDIVLADYKLPAFDGASAVRMVQQRHPDIPVVMVTGAVGDEKAIELLKLGARDYILKDRLARLGPAVKRTLSEERGIRARKAAEKALRESDEKLRAIFDGALDGIVLADTETMQFITANPAFCSMLGYSPEELARLGVRDIHPQQDLPHIAEQFERISRGELQLATDILVKRKDGSLIYADIKGSRVRLGDRNYLVGIFRDTTERKHAETALARSARALGERVKEIGCLYDITNLLLNREWSLEQALKACTQRIPAGWLDPSHTCARIHLGGQVFESADCRETEWKLAAAIPAPGMEPGIIEVFYSGEVDSSQASPFLDEEQNLILAISTQIAQALARRQAEARIRKLSRLYATLSHTNKTIVRAANREELFSRICTGAVEHGKFALAWVGLVDEATHMVKPACHYGAEQGYLADIAISTDDVPAGRGTTGTAIRENRVFYVNDYASDERALPWREASLKRGFRGAAGVPLRFGGKAIGALTLYSDEVNFFDAEQLSLLEEMATDISFALDGFEHEALRQQAEEGRKAALSRLQRALEDSIRVAASVSEVRDPYTAGHQQRVSRLAVAMAGEMGLPAAQVEGIHFGGLIHDIGKVGVPAEILSKPTILTPLEMELIQIHPEAGYEIIKDIEFPWPVAQMILQHHERLDGSGYPAGLKGDEIIPEARIIAVADTVEAMSSHRPYRPGLGMDAALKEIISGSGTRYDAQAVEACLRLIRDKGFEFSAD
jgi:PAS domain S-box-containing protein/putative nucleotidyltransferase with HDIG domain